MFKFIQKNVKKITIVLVIILTILVPVCYYIYQENLKEIERVTWDYWKTGDERRGGLVITNSISENRNKKYAIVSFFNLTTQTILLKEKVNDNLFRIQFETFYLERTGINSFRVKESIISSSTKYTFDEAVEIAKKYDVYKNNPDKDKIYNYPGLNLTPEQIQQDKLKNQQEQEILNQQQKAREEFEKATPAKQIQMVEELKQSFLDNKQEWIKLKGEKYFNEQIKLLDDQIEQIKKEGKIE